MNGNNAPQVSVVIPCYNSAAFLGETLESVAKQSLRTIEVIIVDDGSDDRTVECARATLAKLLVAGTVVERPDSVPKGPGGSRNYGVSLARGEYVAFLDSDDLWLPHHLERAVDTLEQHKESIIAYCSAAETFNEQGKLESLPSGGFPAEKMADILPYLLRGMFITNISLVCPRKIFQKTSGYHEHLRCYEDWWLCLQLARLGPFWLESVPGCLVRVRLESLSRGGLTPRYGGMSRQMFDDRVSLCTDATKCNFLDRMQVRHLKRYTAISLAESLYGSIRARYFRSTREIISLLMRSFPREPRLALQSIGMTLRHVVKWVTGSGRRFCSVKLLGNKQI